MSAIIETRMADSIDAILEGLAICYGCEDIMSRVRIDGCDESQFFAYRPHIEYYFSYVDGNLAGLFELHPKNNASAHMHGLVLPEYRRHSRSMLVNALTHVFEKYDNLITIIDETPTRHTAVANFITKCGFTPVVTIPNMVFIDGQLWDMIVQVIHRDTLVTI